MITAEFCIALQISYYHFHDIQGILLCYVTKHLT